MEKVFGVGIDIVNIERISNLSEKSRTRVFVENEIQYCMGKERPNLHLAARFACKESVLKAFGIPIDTGFQYDMIEINNDEIGRPYPIFHGKMKNFARNNQIKEVLISLAHTEEAAIAIAIAIRQ